MYIKLCWYKRVAIRFALSRSRKSGGNRGFQTILTGLSGRSFHQQFEHYSTNLVNPSKEKEKCDLSLFYFLYFYFPRLCYLQHTDIGDT
ncbi:unnamed protein product [Lasius platythorax]|uniref:Uncharacterized protein n=1 Tax=Lasius platythorax TaxID=488582 RepID=A0AAV2NMM4_9HYME